MLALWINYWSTYKPVGFVLSYALSVIQQYKQKTAWKASLQPIQPLQKIRGIARETRVLWINYWSTHKPVGFILSYALSVTQQCKQKTAWKASLQSIQPLQKIWGIARETCTYGLIMVWGMPQRSVCLALKSLRVYHKSSPYAVVKKEWEIKGVQR